MQSIKTVLLLLAAALPLAAQVPPKEPPQIPEQYKGNAIMCNGKYALCIKAECETKVSENNQVRCRCIIENGWSLGPNSCMDRTNNLTSTYSNRFNGNSSILSCPSAISWAWCYGASCEPDPKDKTGKKAICRCPVVNSEAVILVENKNCGDASRCSSSEMWSAASPQESEFANHYFYWWMTNENPQPPPKNPPNPPATPCPPSQ